MYKMPNAFTEYVLDKITEIIKTNRDDTIQLFETMGIDMSNYAEDSTIRINHNKLSTFIETSILCDVNNHQLCQYILFEIDIFLLEERIEQLIDEWAEELPKDVFISPKRRCSSVCESRCTCPRTFTR
jgi:hypothetical protein